MGKVILTKHIEGEVQTRVDAFPLYLASNSTFIRVSIGRVDVVVNILDLLTFFETSILKSPSVPIFDAVRRPGMGITQQV